MISCFSFFWIFWIFETFETLFFDLALSILFRPFMSHVTTSKNYRVNDNQWINLNINESMKICLLWRILLIRSLIQTRIKRGITTGNETGSSYNRKSDRKWVHRSKGRLNTCTSHKLGGWHRKESGLTDNRKLKPEMIECPEPEVDTGSQNCFTKFLIF